MTSLADPITLSTIEPVATSGLAVTLAYLALDRFRYRRAIEDAAINCHSKYEKDPGLTREAKFGVWNEIVWLARVSANGFRPAGFWGGIYRRIFRHHVDFFIITGLALLSAFALTVGVARNLHLWSWMEWADQPGAARVFFYVCLVATASPFLAMYGGHRCAQWGQARSAFCDEQLLIYQRAQAAAVQAPAE